jgi:hypothetical protein
LLPAICFGVVDLGQCFLHSRMGRFRQRGKDVADLVPPAPLLFGVGEHVADRFPEPQGVAKEGRYIASRSR